MPLKNTWILALAGFLILSAVFHFSSPNIPDLDSFYYIRQAWLYRTEGLFNTAFPWIYHSVIREFSTSLWYGFGAFLIPFTFFKDLTIGIKIAGFLLTGFTLFAIYYVLRRHNLKWPFLWPLAVFFSAPNVLFQFLMTRPQLASLALSPLLFSFLLTGGFWGVFLTSFGITWLHFNFVWVIFLIAGIVAVVKFFTERKVEWTKIAAVFLGAIAGWLARPEAINALKLFYIQVIKQVFTKQSGLALLFGKENYPLGWQSLFQNFAFLTFLGIAVFIFLTLLDKRKRQEIAPANRTFFWASGILAVLFFLFTILVARRVYNFWAEFGMIFTAAVFTFYVPKKSLMNVLLIFIFGSMIIFSGWKGIAALQKNAYQPNEFKEVSAWLSENSSPGDIVINFHWPSFSQLFFWNQKNYYVGGLDPIFQYEYSPAFYWKFHYLARDQVTKKTCGKTECTASELEDTHAYLANELKAKYVLLEKAENPAVNQFMASDPRFEKKFENENEAVYLIKND